MTSVWKPLSRGIGASTAVAAGYLPIAFSFGLATVQAGLPPTVAVLISAFVFAGASQFVLVTMIAGGGSPLTAIAVTCLINGRHIFYGPAVVDALGGRPKRVPRPVIAFGLTDEVMATAVSRAARIPDGERELWYTGLWMGAYTAWVGGTLLGSNLGGHVPVDWTWFHSALDFVLPALFLTLLFDVASRGQWQAILGGGLTTVVCLPFLPANAALAIGMITGAALGTVDARTCRRV